jgi:uncharacterized protein
MKRTADLPDVIPVFPLAGALLLPRARLPLHIFEPRYLQMIDDVLKTPDRVIGMVQPRELPGGKAEPGAQRLQRIGCAGRLTGFSETEDGRYMITLAGLSRFRMVEEVQGFAPYRRWRVDWSDFGRDRGPAESDAGFSREAFLALLGRYLTAKDLSTDWGNLKDAEEELLINALSMLCPFDPADKQALLEAPSLSTRRETMVTLIEFALRGGSGEERLQ